MTSEQTPVQKIAELDALDWPAPLDAPQQLRAWFFVLLAALVVPFALLARRKTRRFGTYMFIGMVITALVVLGVASLVLYFMVRTD